MATALDYSATSNPGGRLPYQWTNWQQVFRPQLGAQLQPQSGQPQGPTQSGAAVAPATGSQIIAGRQSARDQVIMNNPLWKAFRPQQPTPQKGMLANVTEAGSPQEDAQSFFGGVSDTAPQEAVPYAVAPAPQMAFQPSRNIVTPYGTASVRFGGPQFAGGGSKLRF